MNGEGTLGEVLAGEARWTVCRGDWQSLELSPVDHVITDPPFSAHVHGKQRRLTFPDAGTFPSRGVRTSDLGFDCLTAVERRRFAQTVGSICGGWAVVKQDFESANLMRRSLEAAGMRHWRIGAWDKCDTGAPQFNGKGPAQWGEALVIAHSKRPFKWNAGGKRGVWRFPTEVSLSPKVRNNDRHPCGTPLALYLALVADFTEPGDLVFDPYAGLATVGVACIRLGRRYLGVEREPKWVGLARERIRAEESNSTLQARRVGQIPLFAGAAE